LDSASSFSRPEKQAQTPLYPFASLVVVSPTFFSLAVLLLRFCLLVFFVENFFSHLLFFHRMRGIFRTLPMPKVHFQLSLLFWFYLDWALPTRRGVLAPRYFSSQSALPLVSGGLFFFFLGIPVFGLPFKIYVSFSFSLVTSVWAFRPIPEVLVRFFCPYYYSPPLLGLLTPCGPDVPDPFFVFHAGSTPFFSFFFFPNLVFPYFSLEVICFPPFPDAFFLFYRQFVFCFFLFAHEGFLTILQ